MGSAGLLASAAVLRLRAPTEEGDGHDADDGDERHQERVLHEGGAPLVITEAGTEIGAEELVAGEQLVLSLLVFSVGPLPY